MSGFVELDPCPYGTREGDSDLVRAEQLVRGSRQRNVRVLVDGGTGPRADALARYGVDTLRKIGLRARLARTPRERRRAQLGFADITPSRPVPSPYLSVVSDVGVRSDVGALERDEQTPKAARWAALDRDVVEGALIAPYGLAHDRSVALRTAGRQPVPALPPGLRTRLLEPLPVLIRQAFTAVWGKE